MRLWRSGRQRTTIGRRMARTVTGSAAHFGKVHIEWPIFLHFSIENAQRLWRIAPENDDFLLKNRRFIVQLAAPRLEIYLLNLSPREGFVILFLTNCSLFCAERSDGEGSDWDGKPGRGEPCQEPYNEMQSAISS